MSLYHETADLLTAPASAGGSLKSRIFGKRNLKTSPAQVYALASETCKWSSVLKEVIEKADILRIERKLTPILALLLVHDLLLSKGGIALPASHGLRACIERHKARLNAEFTRARLRRRAGSVEGFRQQIETELAGASGHPRWVRVNVLQTTLEDQLEGTFRDFKRVYSIKDVTNSQERCLFLDENIPNLIAVSPSFEIVKTDAYKSGAIILQDKASCFPAYLLNPLPEDGDIIDSCAAPGNKTTHLAAIIHSRTGEDDGEPPQIYAFEKDKKRAETLERMAKLAGGSGMIHIGSGQDFLQVKSDDPLYKSVGCLLLDPSCSGSGIVGRDAMPPIYLPELASANSHKSSNNRSHKRKRDVDPVEDSAEQTIIDDDGKETIVSSEKELHRRLEALSSFQLTLLLHAMEFPSARKLTYSTCSIHAQENEQVVLKALQSDIAKRRGWHILPRELQVRGLGQWPVRGSLDAADGNKIVAEACIRSYKDDGRGVMGFFVAPFVRGVQTDAVADDGPFLRDENGLIIRDTFGMPSLKLKRSSASTGAQDASLSTGVYKESEEDPHSKSASDLEDEASWDGFDD